MLIGAELLVGSYAVVVHSVNLEDLRGSKGFAFNTNDKNPEYDPMKQLFIAILLVSAMTLLGGCVCAIDGGSKHPTIQPTTGQQLIDLQKAKEAGAITDSEYQAKKEKLLGTK